MTTTKVNSYGNEFGYHTPKRSLEIFNKITAAMPEIVWKDVSWNGDLSDSIESDLGDGRSIQIFLGNSDVNDSDNEKFAEFYVCIYGPNGMYDDREGIKNVEELKEAITALKLINP